MRQKLVALTAEVDIGLCEGYARLTRQGWRSRSDVMPTPTIQAAAQGAADAEGLPGRVMRDLRRQLDSIPQGSLRESVLDMLADFAATNIICQALTRKR